MFSDTVIRIRGVTRYSRPILLSVYILHSGINDALLPLVEEKGTIRLSYRKERYEIHPWYCAVTLLLSFSTGHAAAASTVPS